MPSTRFWLQTAMIATLATMTLPASAEPPQLIPREVLFDPPAARTSPAISPDATLLGFVAPDTNGVSNIWVEPLDGGEARRITADTRQGIYGFNWAYDGLHVLYVQDTQGDENWHLYAANVKTGAVRDLTPYDGVQASNILTDPNHPDVVLVGLNLRDRRYVDLHRVQISTGQTTLEAEDPGDITEWATDPDFRIRAAVALDAENSDTIIRVRDAVDAPWREIARWTLPETGSVLYQKVFTFTPEGDALLVQSTDGSEMSRLVILDAQTGEELRVIAEDPTMDIWNVWWVPQVVLDPRTHAVQAVGFDYLMPEWRVLDAKLQVDFDTLKKLHDGMFFIRSRDLADQNWIVEYYSDTNPGSFYHYQRETRTARHLFDAMPALADYQLAKATGITIPARDGLKLPSYLTLPVGVEAKNLPLILMPHGGPWARDDWGFDPWVQCLANRGYAVLQVNFRGSTGYGKSFINAATRQWGAAMQDDLTDAVRWAVAEGIADPERVAITGGSYGGYATLAGITFTPEVYRCAVAMVAPSNIRTLFESFPPYWGVRKKRWIYRVGPVETDDAFNQKISPLFHVDKIQAPLLIMHGTNDPRVKLSESETIVAAMQERDLDVTFVVYPDEGHGLGRPDNMLDFMGRTEALFARYLGGRAQAWAPVAGSSADVRVGSDPSGGQ